MKLLLIEDDKIIGANIQEYLEENSFLVTLKEDWESGEKEAMRNNYDLFIFDVMLPHKSGFEVAKSLREQGRDTPIIFLTAKDDLSSKEIGFSVGADDYISKPFKLKELLLRIRSILKRIHKHTELEKITAGEVELDLSLKEVKRDNEVISLTPKEFMILEYLMKNKGKVVPKKEILEYIWWINNDIWSDVIRAHMLTLRKKINKWWKKDPIKTIRGIWFKFQD